MELNVFVSESLKNIIDGVRDAQEYASEVDAKINPVVNSADRDRFRNSVRTNDGTGRIVQDVHFDVLVTVTEGKATKGGIGVFAGAIGIGTQGQSEAENSSMSRIKFSVPVIFPVQKLPD